IHPHVHVHSSILTPPQFSKPLLPHALTTLLTHPHEIPNLSPITPIPFILEQPTKPPLHIYFILPSCVPALSFQPSGPTLKPKDLKPL
ncbi:amidohydrolase family protein, partial [Bacillus pumilus]|uniref:amidohydrolase family protein n=1 Tax=Bacillus pumilus TaxID=1408 RepID=UPI00119FDC2F